MCIASGLLMTVVLHIPVVGIIPLYLAAPLAHFFPEIAGNSAHGGIAFLMAYLSSVTAWVLYAGYYALLAFALALVDRVLNLRRQQ